jgi:hypothetical protein
MANRVWSWLFGRGLVHPGGRLQQGPAPFGGGLLGVLAKEFKGSKYSIKALYLASAIPNTIQRSSAQRLDDDPPSFAASLDQAPRRRARCRIRSRWRTGQGLP